MGGAARARNGGQVSGGCDGLSSGNGCAWEVPATVSAMRDSNPADQVCFERDELLSDVPDEREAAGRSGVFALAARRLAKIARGIGNEDGEKEANSRQVNVESRDSLLGVAQFGMRTDRSRKQNETSVSKYDHS